MANRRLCRSSNTGSVALAIVFKPSKFKRLSSRAVWRPRGGMPFLSALFLECLSSKRLLLLTRSLDPRMKLFQNLHKAKLPQNIKSLARSDLQLFPPNPSNSKADDSVNRLAGRTPTLLQVTLVPNHQERYFSDDSSKTFTPSDFKRFSTPPGTFKKTTRYTLVVKHQKRYFPDDSSKKPSHPHTLKL